MTEDPAVMSLFDRVAAGEPVTWGQPDWVTDRAGRAWLLDLNWLSTGPRWTDFVGPLPLARADGIDVDAWLRRSPLTRDVTGAAVDAWLVVIAAYMLDSAERPTRLMTGVT